MQNAGIRSQYYIIFSILRMGKEQTRLFPLVYSDKVSADSAFKEISGDSVVSASSFGLEFDDADEIGVDPFLYLEKTIISADEMVSDETILGTAEGVIESKFIPMDFVSAIYFKKNIKNTESSKYIDELIKVAGGLL